MLFRSGSATTNGTSGAVIAYSPAFYATPKLNITLKNGGSGDVLEFSGESASGFTLKTRNSGGTYVNRDFDWYAGGYGQ